MGQVLPCNVFLLVRISPGDEQLVAPSETSSPVYVSPHSADWTQDTGSVCDFYAEAVNAIRSMEENESTTLAKKPLGPGGERNA